MRAGVPGGDDGGLSGSKASLTQVVARLSPAVGDDVVKVVDGGQSGTLTTSTSSYFGGSIFVDDS